MSSEVVKDRILRASRELFAEYGIKGVSIRKIAAEAGINHALVIRYFGSKSVIVNQILRDEIEYLTGRPSEGQRTKRYRHVNICSQFTTKLFDGSKKRDEADNARGARRIVPGKVS